MTSQTRHFVSRGATSTGLFDLECLERRVLMSTWIDTSNRATVAQFYQNQYLSSANIDPGWTGSYTTGNPGTTTAAFKQKVLDRINYYRSMAGEDNVTNFDAAVNAKDQQAALMMSANNNLSHDPPPNWLFWTQEGHDIANKSNLSLGAWGSNAIDLYMHDYNQELVGHRRWILYPQNTVLATGDVPAQGQYPGSNALYTVTDKYFDPRPATRQPFVAWPAAGYNPYQVTPTLWSFGYAGANFSNAQVTITRGGAPVGVSQKAVQDLAGEISLVWTIADPIDATEKTYNVQVSNVVINGAPQVFSYTVTSFDPTVVASPPVLQSTSIGLPGNTTQRSMVKQIAFTFDKPVTIAAGALSVSLLNTGGSGSNNGAPPINISGVVNAPTSSNGGATWTYTFIANTDFTEVSGSLPDGIYTATLDASKVAANGAAMAGPNPTTTFHRLFGDINGSKDVNNADFGLFRNTFGRTSADGGFNAGFDFDNSGAVNNADFAQFRNRFGGRTFNY
jgi:hypothetical protein